jgi:AmmeMemoRadiSam system protein A
VKRFSHFKIDSKDAITMPDHLTDSERLALLKIARQALETAVRSQPFPQINREELPASFTEPGAVFVTLTRNRELRGCIGALEAYQPLVDDVCEHASAAALQDYRFPPVTEQELPEIEIEISRLTRPDPLPYRDAADLLKKLRPKVDGVILRDGWRRATFLPQVWEKIDSPEEFLSHLCYKMGAAPNLWQQKKLEVLVYQVEEFHE